MRSRVIKSKVKNVGRGCFRESCSYSRVVICILVSYCIILIRGERGFDL